MFRHHSYVALDVLNASRLNAVSKDSDNWRMYARMLNSSAITRSARCFAANSGEGRFSSGEIGDC